MGMMMLRGGGVAAFKLIFFGWSTAGHWWRQPGAELGG